MKGGFKVIRWVGIILLPLLLYVHQYFLLFHTSYQINDKQRLLNQRTENYRRLRFEVDQLRAPRLLEEHLKALRLDLSLPKEINVVKIPPAEQVKIPLQVREVAPQDWSGRLFSWMGRWVEVAQAKVEND